MVGMLLAMPLMDLLAAVVVVVQVRLVLLLQPRQVMRQVMVAPELPQLYLALL
jgi:hypothetical protein